MMATQTLNYVPTPRCPQNSIYAFRIRIPQIGGSAEPAPHNPTRVATAPPLVPALISRLPVIPLPPVALYVLPLTPVAPHVLSLTPVAYVLPLTPIAPYVPL